MQEDDYGGYLKMIHSSVCRQYLPKKKLMSVILRYLSTTEKRPRSRIQAHYEQLSEFERGRIIGLKDAGWANRRTARHMGRNDAAI
ncbi:hypothetical protein TNCV_1371031 [Trichonephila clavipes]|nr:hypothetical protein TNCV_1371031 [Trichonephila clavipes]